MIRALELLMLSLMTALVLGRATPSVPAPAAARFPSPSANQLALYGKVYTPPRVAFDFVLPASSGQTVRLADYQGRVVLLFFGYTACPDVCPTTLADIKQALAEVGEAAQGVNVFLITVDPARDSLTHLHEYLGYFHEPGYLGLRGSEAETIQIATHYGVKFYREEDATLTGGYSVAHSTQLILINRQGEWAMTMPYGTTVAHIAANVRYWLAQ